MSKQKKQHTIPCSYLAAWIEPVTPPGQTSAIWRISKDRSTTRRKSPENSFTETDRYTIRLTDGTRDLTVENSLARIEGDFADVLRAIRRRDRLSVLQRAKLSVFTAAMLGRSKKQGDYMKEQWTSHIESVRKMEDKLVTAEHTLSQQMEASIERSHADLVIGTIQAASPILLGMTLTIMTTDDPNGFITSDAPAVMYNPKAHTMPSFYRSPGLIQTDVEITLPLTPQHLALFSHKSIHRLYFPIQGRMVDEINRTTYFFCKDEFVSWKGNTKEAWFEEREAPPDAWERKNENSIMS